MQEQNRSIGTHEVPQIYTAITGNKDTARSDITCYTEYDAFKRPVMNAKIYKILFYKFTDSDIVIWVDGNIFPTVPLETLVKELLGDADLFAFKHFDRDDVYDEADAAMGLGGEQFPYIEKHKKYLESINFPKHTGLCDCSVLIRRNTKEVRDFCNAWWAEICCHSNRDQLSFPVILKQFPNLKTRFLEGNPRNHKYFKYVPHI